MVWNGALIRAPAPARQQAICRWARGTVGSWVGICVAQAFNTGRAASGELTKPASFGQYWPCPCEA